MFLIKKKHDHNVNRIVLTRLNKFEKHGTSSHPLMDPTKQNIKSIQNKMDKILSNKPSNMNDLKQVDVSESFVNVLFISLFFFSLFDVCLPFLPHS
jgi:hypothetical protein